MRTSTATTRRSLLAVVIAPLVATGSAAVALLAVSAEPSATGAADPCAASEVARTIGSVAKSTGDYLDSHPETNQAMTTVLQQPAGQGSLGSLKSYFEANPKAASDLQSIGQPLTNLSTQCKLPISVPQALGIAQAATGPLPGPAPRANNVG
ncbi:hemophore [Mycobacterium lacus]|nr:hemophore [Mycobacterium lacus]MCV7121996.1 hemophore [Mycobacterium lacus]ORW00236.1 hemophore [Mycobacterium lacus]